LVLRHVHILSISGDPGRERTVVIGDGKILAIGDDAAVAVPAGAVTIEGSGGFLLPGLIDMHVHMRMVDAPRYLRAGILTVRNMWGHSAIPPLMRSIQNGTVLGPDIVSASPGLDGPPAQWPETQLITDPTLADTVVGAQLGWPFIKVYQSLSAPVFSAIVEAARRRGLPVVGHVPTAVSIEDALNARMVSIEHLTGYDRAVSRQGRIGTWGWVDVDTTRFRALAMATATAGTWNCPTLAIYTVLAKQNSPADWPAITEHRRQFVRWLHLAGARVVAGTDAGINVVPPGSSLIDEMKELEASGYTPVEALAAATVNAAELLLGHRELGTVGVGAPAQLVLVPTSPLEDLSVFSRLVGVVQHGRWLPAATIDSAIQAHK
jgi:imidazolonepropionase-like amidohydrolase